MKRKYFYISILFMIASIITFIIGLYYGFASEAFYIAKPITVFQYSAFLAFAFFITSIEDKLKRGPIKIYLLIGFFVAMLSFYEILFNYFLWFSLYNLYGIGTSLDAIRNSVPYASNITLVINSKDLQLLSKAGLYPVSLNIASKISTLIFFCAIYWIYLIHNLRRGAE